MPKTRMALLELVGYREWTESIGDDREWKLQITQSQIYKKLQEAAAEYNGFIMPMRYDYMVLIASNLRQEELLQIYKVAKEISPVPVRLASACGDTPVDAVEEAWRYVRSGTDFEYAECNDREVVIAGHFDINGITAMTRKLGVLTTYSTMLHVISEIETRAHYRGAIAQYLGGDNILVVLPHENYEEIIEELIAVHDLKVGVGIAGYARRALALAAEALHEIRIGKVRGRVNVKTQG